MTGSRERKESLPTVFRRGECNARRETVFPGAVLKCQSCRLHFLGKIAPVCAIARHHFNEISKGMRSSVTKPPQQMTQPL